MSAAFGGVSRLFSETAQRVREGRKAEHIADALPAMNRAIEAMAAYFDPPIPIRFSYYDPSEANASLLAAVSGDYPSEDWRRVYAIEAGDPLKQQGGPDLGPNSRLVMR